MRGVCVCVHVCVCVCVFFGNTKTWIAIKLSFISMCVLIGPPVQFSVFFVQLIFKFGKCSTVSEVFFRLFFSTPSLLRKSRNDAFGDFSCLFVAFFLISCVCVYTKQTVFILY